METTESKLARLAQLIEEQTRASLVARNLWSGSERDVKVTIKPGAKYTKVDRGTSGKYMVDGDGNIWGIKAYGVIHRGHQYGTLDTINQYNWGGYVATKKA